MKKRIGIISIYGNYNFGNKLQNYAVQKVCHNLGFDAEILKISNKKTNGSISKLKYEIKAFICEKILKRWYRNKAFWNFEKDFLNTSKHYIFSSTDNKKFEKEYDFFIVGSDQVWNPHFGLKGDLIFLDFVEKKPKIAFSASFGVDEISEKLEEKYKKGLNKLDYISVREDVGKKIIENLTTRKDIEILVDPTMLLTKEEWQQISKKPHNLKEKKYILNYFLGNLSESRKKTIYDFANKNDYVVINILDENDPFYNSGPSEFVYLEEHAELICTDSFHSSVFGILMNTPFIVFEREDEEERMNSRLETLLKKFELEDRMFNGKIKKEMEVCDFKKSDKILEDERQKANNFLKKALNEVKQ